MFPAKIYVGQIAVVLGIVVVSTWGATQWTAAALARAKIDTPGLGSLDLAPDRCRRGLICRERLNELFQRWLWRRLQLVEFFRL